MKSLLSKSVLYESDIFIAQIGMLFAIQELMQLFVIVNPRDRPP